ncbi:MAG TPA: MFS transporter [Xanthobacteraceae bacterium]|nr:MFS transporter [Xanthobacteraceae bacterium]
MPKGPPPAADSAAPDNPDAAAAFAYSRWAGHTPLSHAELRRIVFGIMLAMFLGALDQTIVATALPSISGAFGEAENLSWVVTAYLLTSTAVTPLYGKLSDMVGRRTMMLAGIAIFMAGSLIAALATDMLMLILGRAVQGLGAGGLLPLAQTVIGDVVLPKERGRYQSYMGIMWMSAAILGPLLGGGLSQYLHWSLIFWINIPLGLLAFWLCDRTLRRVSQVMRPHRLDVLGSALMMAAAVALLLALTTGGVRYPWLSAPVIGLVALSAALWVLFFWRLAKAEEPFVPLTMLSNPVVRLGTLGAACNVAAMIGMTIFLPLYFDMVHGLSASHSGVALIPLVVISNIAAVFSGRSLGWFHHYKRVPIVGLSLSLVSALALAWQPYAPLPLVLVEIAAIGSGIGTVYPVTTVSVQNAVPRYQLGIVTGTMNFFRMLLSAVIVAALGALVLGGVNIKGETGLSVAVIKASAGGAELALIFRWVFAAIALVLGTALVALLAMEERPLAGRADIPKAAKE